MEFEQKDSYKVDVMQIVAIFMSIKVVLSFSSICRPSGIVDNALTVLSICICCIVVINKIYSLRTLFLSFLLGLVALYTCVKIGSYEILISVMTILALKGYDFDKFLKMIYKTEVALLIIHVVYSMAYSLFINYDEFIIEGDRRWRFTFGFVHPNSFSAILFGVILIYVWFHFETNMKDTLIKSSLIEVIAFALSDSRTALMSYLVLVLLIFMKMDGRLNAIIRMITRWCVPLLSVIMFILIRGYKNGWVISILVNRFLTGRIRLGSYALEKSGLTLFGQAISYMSTSVVWDEIWQLNSFTFDNMYSYCMMSAGLIWLVILSIMAIVISKKLNLKCCIAFVVWAVYGLSEVIILNGYISFPIFLITLVLNSSVSNQLLYIEEGRREI
ncbi:MAG: hypothetical protein LUG93_05235 [Lachnospiraceae bacterium]|nr:hypothetical protein [Lachnospiraceae bacterium]